MVHLGEGPGVGQEGLRHQTVHLIHLASDFNLHVATNETSHGLVPPMPLPHPPPTGDPDWQGGVLAPLLPLQVPAVSKGVHPLGGHTLGADPVVHGAYMDPGLL